MYRYDPATGKHEQCYSGEMVGGFTVQADGALLLFMPQGAIAKWRDGALETVVPEIPMERGFRFNDVIADPRGRVFCGTMDLSGDHRGGRLYRFDPDGTLTQLLDGVGTSNGMGFTADRKTMYFTDSPKRHIYRFDYDEATGAIANQRVFIETPEGEGVPDGMTVDAEGYIWSARWNGSALYRYTPGGREERRIAFPAKKVSSVTFAGDAMTDMYVTTALARGTPAEEGEGAGGLFRLRLGIRGVPEFLSRIQL
jgi:D-xylonolactonase